MTEHETESMTFGPDEQAEILRLAARMQDSQLSMMSLAQLEALAAEAEIEARFVHLAAHQVAGQRARMTGRDTSPNAVSRDTRSAWFTAGLCTFLAVQFLGVGRFVHPDAPYNWPSTGLLNVILAAGMLGALFAIKPNGWLKSLAVLLGSTVFLSLVIGIEARIVVGRLGPDIWWLPVVVGAQGVVAYLSGSLWPHFRRIRNPFAKTTP